MWYDSEVTKYDWNNPGFSMKTGHFTQVVWKDTKRCGFGFGEKTDIVTGHYYPPGNYNDDYDENVPRLID